AIIIGGAGGWSVDGCSRVLGVVETVRNVSLRPEPHTTGRGCTMKKFTLAAVAALAFSAAPAFAADMPVKAVKAAAPPAWDIAFGSAIASDYIWRGITQSNHKP